MAAASDGADGARPAAAAGVARSAGAATGRSVSREGGLAAALRWQPDSDRFQFIVTLLLGLSAAYGITYLVISAGRGWVGGFGDSFGLWSWGRFLGDHVAASIYDPAVLHRAQLAMGMPHGRSFPFAYPPSFMPVLWLLGRLPGPAALAALMALSLPFYLWATLGRNWRGAGLAAALAAPTTALTIVSGQSGFLIAGLLAGGLRLAGSNPVAAGVLFGLATYKPQLGLLVPVALIAARRWRTLLAASLTALLLAVATGLLFGLATWPSWLASIPAYSRQFAAENGRILHLMPTVLAALLRLGIAPATAHLVQFAATAGAAAVVWVLFRRRADPLAGAALLVAALLATPYAFVYDMPVLATAIIWFVGERRRSGDAFGTGEVLAMGCAMFSPTTLAAAGGNARFPLAVLSLIALLAVIARRCRAVQLP